MEHLSKWTLIAGEDPVATDATACRVMRINPYEVSHIRKAYEKGLGNIDDIQILGERLEDVAHAFER